MNLEKELIRQNRKLATPTELLLVKEFELFSEFTTNDALSRVGLNRNVILGSKVKSEIISKLNQTKDFSQERVFHISQIKNICEKYHLRFLNSKLYRGTIDRDLANKITMFEAAYLQRCTEKNTKIMAPVESFALQIKPKDPLFFYQINEEYYYLIHKWGNDLHWTRSLIKYFTHWLPCAFSIIPILFLPMLIDQKIGSIIGGIGAAIVILVMGFNNDMQTIYDRRFSFFQPNKWDSETR